LLRFEPVRPEIDDADHGAGMARGTRAEMAKDTWRRIVPGVAALAVLVGSLGPAHAVCAGLRADMRAIGAVRPAAPLAAAVERKRRDIMRIEVQLRRNGCGGGSMLYFGSEIDGCSALASELPALEAELRSLIAERDASIRIDALRERETIAAALEDNGCNAPPVLERRASYSQFRNDPGMILRGDGSGVQDASIASPYRSGSRLMETDAVIHFEDQVQTEPQAEIGPVDTAAGASPAIPLDERLQERNVRVVGPQFLPDRSEAIDLTAPARSFYP
jgi:hypothetical protein